jgi:hypothetical protein
MDIYVWFVIIQSLGILFQKIISTMPHRKYVMKLAFDLISDLHVETWDAFDWTGQPTSPYCVVAGDVAQDRSLVIDVLTHLGECYRGGVFYIDGNDEHRHYFANLGDSYRDLHAQVSQIDNVVYMQDNVIITNGVAFLATNGWWTFDFDPELDQDQSMAWWQQHADADSTAPNSVLNMAHHDAAYLANSVHKLQTHQEVKSIVLITHTVPAPWIITHDIDLVDHWRYNGMGNTFIESVLDQDTERKIKTWCFGHYHKTVDQLREGIRYVNNPRGRGHTDWCQPAYYPRRIEIEF